MNSRLVSRIVYSLKKRFSKSITLRNISNITPDFETGESTSTNSDLVIAKAIVMPVKQSTSEISAVFNRLFSYGGDYGKDVTRVIIETVDLGTFVLSKNTQVIIDSSIYEIKVLSNYEKAYFLEVNSVTGDVDG